MPNILKITLSEADACGGVTEMDDGSGNTKWYIRHGFQFIPNSVTDATGNFRPGHSDASGNFQPGNSVSYLKPQCPCFGM